MARSENCIPSPFNTSVLVASLGLVIAATVAVLLRVVASYKARGRTWHYTDTWLVVAALTFCYGYLIQTICGCAMVGLDCFHPNIDLQWAEDEILKILWTDVLLVIPASALVKISVLEFYKRIFLNRWFRRGCNILVFLCSGWLLGAIITNFFLTTPFSAIWHASEAEKGANFPYRRFFLAIFGIDIGLNFLVLCMPVSEIVRLQMRVGKKLRVAGIFALGSFCLVCSIVRFYYADRQLSRGSQDAYEATLNARDTIMWSRIEPAASIIAACLPTFGPLVPPGCSLTATVPSVGIRTSPDNEQGCKGTQSSSSRNMSTNQTLERQYWAHSRPAGHNNSQFASVRSEWFAGSRRTTLGQINITSEFSVRREISDDEDDDNSSG